MAIRLLATAILMGASYFAGKAAAKRADEVTKTTPETAEEA